MIRTYVLWGLIFVFVYVAKGLIIPVALGAVIGTLLYPPYKKMIRRKFSSTMAASLLTLAVTLLVLLPVTILSLIGVNSFLKLLPMIQERAQGQFDLAQVPIMKTLAEFMQRWFSVEFAELLKGLQQLAQSSAGALAQVMGSLLASLPGMFVFMLIMIISTFFFIVDGKKALEKVKNLELIPDSELDYLINKSTIICRALVMATLIVALIQASLFVLGCAIAGISNLFVIGFIVFLMSFVPLVGPTPLTFGMAFYHLFFGETSTGVIVLITAGMVSTIDNFVRPFVLKGEANLHPLLAFVGVFGGLQTMGFAGIFLGPLFAGIFASAIKLLIQRPPPQK